MALLAAVLALLPAAWSLRVPGSPFPHPTGGFNKSALLFHVDTSSFSPSDSLSAATLQGILSQNRSAGPIMYRTPGTAPDAPYMLWLTETARTFNVTVNASMSSDLWGLAALLMAAYPPSPIAGYILCSLTDGSVNAAIALGTVLGGIAVTEDNVARAQALSLRALADVRGRSLEWVLAALGPGNFSSRVTLIQDPQKTGMADVAIAMRALAWYPAKAADEPLAQRVWGSLSPPFIALGWGPDEKTTVATASAYGGAVLASDWASNLDVLSAYDLPAFSSQASPAAAAPAAPGVHTAAFLMSDGDNAQFILGPFAQDQAHFGSPDRGKVPMGWTLPPTLAELAPVALRYFYAHATAMDEFVGGVSGASYYYPDIAALRPAAAASLVNLSQAYLASAGFRTLNILAAADGLLNKDIAAAFLQAPTLDAIFHYPYNDYSGDHGAVQFVEGKPVIGGRFCLWGDGTDPNKDLKNVTQAAQALVEASRDATTAGGYSLIPVHAWSHNVSDALRVMQLVQEMAPGAVEFVTPSVLAARIAQNIPH